MSRIIKTEVFTFAELSAEAKEKAIQAYRERDNIEFFDDFILEEEKEKLSLIGFNDAKIAYSGFWSQGDGASFTTDNVDIEKVIKHFKLGNKYRKVLNMAKKGEFLPTIKRAYYHHYVHENTTEFILTSDYYGDTIDSLIDTFEIELTQEIRELSKGVYKSLEEAYDYTQTDEYIIDEIEANEYEFISSGQLY